ncbi:MAG: hypothetical protein Q8K99_05165 [Actinomycetota bacterium]|nr:hypothetical protein [Actinomycetota bacterium]
MEEKTRRILHVRPETLRYALSTAILDLTQQQRDVFGLLLWLGTMDQKRVADVDFLPGLARMMEDGMTVDSVEELRTQASIVALDLSLCRYVDSAITFFRDACAIGLLLNPVPLRSAQKQMSLNEVLGFDSMPELVASLAVRKSQEMARDDFQLLAFCADTLKMPVFADESERLQAKTAIRTRNLLVHNSGRIDARHVKALNLGVEMIDQQVELTYGFVRSLIAVFDTSTERVAAHLESEWREHFPDIEDPTVSPTEVKDT